MKLLFHKLQTVLNKPFLIIFLIYFVAELIVVPTGEFPLNDDWSYFKAVESFHLKWEINFGSWPAMTLLTHILWGTLFTKVFGLSFFVLRISNIVSALIGVIFLQKLINDISANKKMGLLAGLVLLFNPIYFNVANTYLTDVNFTTLVIIVCYFIYRYFTVQSKIYLLIILIGSVLLVLLRQYGIVLSVAFIASSIFIEKRKVQSFSFAVIIFFISILILKYYENYLKEILPDGSSYKFSNEVNIFSEDFLKMFKDNIKTRITTILLQTIIYTSPITLAFISPTFRSQKSLINVSFIAISLFLSFSIFKNELFLHTNIFTNTKLGPETFYQSFNLQQHAEWDLFVRLLVPLKYILSTATFYLLLSVIYSCIISNEKLQLFNPFKVFLVCTYFGLVIMILVPLSYFDRYHLPLIALALILSAYLKFNINANWTITVFFIAIFFYISSFGTKDYFNLNRAKWAAYYYLKNDLKVSPDKINGGFEINFWNDGINPGWRDIFNLDGYDYLIQFKAEPGFVPLKEFPFQRYFPLREDKISIFVKDKKALK